ncbi:MAG: PspC domain-containing protein [archaeon]|nr:PspC domain-containing protein [archaeon]
MAAKKVKRLYRSKNERMLAGVCGGIAEYLNLDPTIVRLLWVAFSLFGWAGVLLYIIFAIVVPEDK